MGAKSSLASFEAKTSSWKSVLKGKSECFPPQKKIGRHPLPSMTMAMLARILSQEICFLIFLRDLTVRILKMISPEVQADTCRWLICTLVLLNRQISQTNAATTTQYQAKASTVLGRKITTRTPTALINRD